MPQFRFTVRRMMIAVAIVGIGLGLGLWGMRMTRLARDYRRAEERSGMRRSAPRYLLAEADEYRMAIEEGKSDRPDTKDYPRYEARACKGGCTLLRLAARYERAAAPLAPRRRARPARTRNE